MHNFSTLVAVMNQGLSEKPAMFTQKQTLRKNTTMKWICGCYLASRNAWLSPITGERRPLRLAYGKTKTNNQNKTIHINHKKTLIMWKTERFLRRQTITVKAHTFCVSFRSWRLSKVIKDCIIFHISSIRCDLFPCVCSHQTGHVSQYKVQGQSGLTQQY